MIISYPILTEPPNGNAADETEDAWLERLLAMAESQKYAYPTRTHGTHTVWHGGLHLSVTRDVPIRAIADGTIIAFRQASTSEDYGEELYDTSFVLLKHETETGDSTPVVFYSLYMNLASREYFDGRVGTLPPAYRMEAGPDVKKPKDARQAKVYRRDILGYPGYQHQRSRWGFHFEIFTTEADLARFFRDSTAVREAGSKDFYGDAHFIVPAGKAFVANHPRLPTTTEGPWNNPKDDKKPMFPVGIAGTNNEPLYVTVRLEKGERITVTRVKTTEGGYQEIGRAEQPGYVYALLTLAETLYPDNPSAGLEWLRFGRVLSTERTNRTENWQLVPYSAEASGYIDLAQPDVIRLSDADFPHWLGWKAVEEGEMLSPEDAIVDEPATLERLRDQSEQGKATLRHLVVKHPSEWDLGDLETRYAKLRHPGGPLVSDKSWSSFKAQADKFGFWPETGLPRSVWHFHPLQFIHHMRRALWLSESELRQAVPARMVRGVGGGIPRRIEYEAAVGQSGALIADHRNTLNAMWRKYGVTSRIRLAAFLGNSVQETVWLRVTEEEDAGGKWYAPWHGRGFLQLTHPSNYLDYWAFRGRRVDRGISAALRAAQKQIAQMPADLRTNTPLAQQEEALPAQLIQWRGDVESIEYDAADSAGYYWLKNRAQEEADRYTPSKRREITLHPKSQLKKNQRFTIYENVSFRRVSCIVNLPGHIDREVPALNGLVDRYHAYAYAQVLLFDHPTFLDKAEVRQIRPEEFEWKRD